MQGKILVVVVLGLIMTAKAAGQLKPVKLSLSDLPKAIKYAGVAKEAFRYSDKTGDHLVLTAETGVYRNKAVKHENDGRDAELYAYSFLVTKDSVRQEWKVFDYIYDCDVDLEAAFVEKTLQVTDLDGNGTAEVWVMYRTVCHGDVSPKEMKLIMYQGARKYAMRGTTKVQPASNETYGGAYTFDAAFNAAPNAFRVFAQQLWKKHVVEAN